MNLFVEELNQVKWQNLRTMQGNAAHIPEAFSEMTFAVSEEVGRTAYNNLDNSLVVQGQLFEAAEHLIPFLILGSLKGTEIGKWLCLDLLVEIAGGYSDSSEDEIGNINLEFRCKEAVRRGIPVYYHFLESADMRTRDCAAIILAWVESEHERLNWYSQRIILGEVAQRFLEEQLQKIQL
jgi:hypothetical protein